MKFTQRKPCGNCPFRKEAPLAHWAPDQYLMLARLTRREGDPHQGGFACHKGLRGPAEDREPCVGWMLDQKRRGLPAVALRIMLAASEEAQQQFEEIEPDGEQFESVEELVRLNLLADQEKYPERYE